MLTSFSSSIIPISLSRAFLLHTSLPLLRLSPTKMHPSVSFALLPECILMPSNPGTPTSSGSYFLNLGDFVTTTLKVPSGTADFFGTFSSPPL